MKLDVLSGDPFTGKASLITSYLNFNHHNQTDFCLSEAHAAETSCDVMNLVDYPEAYSLLLRSDKIEGLSDEEIVQLVRSGQAIGKYVGHVINLSANVDVADRYTRLLTIAEIESTYSEAYLYLKTCLENPELIERICTQSDYKKIQQCVNAYENIVFNRHIASGYVYCLSDQNGHYKIGYSRNLDARISQLRTQPPFEIILVSAHRVCNMRAFEAALHEYFQARRLKGEWFKLTDDDIDLFKSLRWRNRYIHLTTRTEGE